MGTSVAKKEKILTAQEILEVSQSPEIVQITRLFPTYKDGEVLYDLQVLAQYAKGSGKEGEASRLASSIFARLLPVMAREVKANKKWRGQWWFDLGVVVAGFASVLFLLVQAGVVQVVL